MGWFNADDELPDEDIAAEEAKAAVTRLADEMIALSQELLLKARQLQEEIKSARESGS